MTEKTRHNIRLGSWDDLKDDAAPIRMQVFVVEQRVPLEEEIDVADSLCVHAVAYAAQGVAIGTGRLLPDGHIGRMSVLMEHRGKGVGGEILQALMDHARLIGFSEVALSAQTHALGFYRQYGFVEEGEEYLDANIPHLMMRRSL